MKANEAIAVGVEACRTMERRFAADSEMSDLHTQAAKTLAALSVELTKAVTALARIADTLHGWRNGYQGGTYFISGPELEKLADEMRVLLAALGLDPAPGGAPSEPA